MTYPKRERQRAPATGWLVTRAAVCVLEALSPKDRAVLLSDPMSRRAWHLFRNTLHQLDRTHGSRAAWLHTHHAHAESDRAPDAPSDIDATPE
jgi:hypothetical protein